jgi:O-antigen ligase
MSDLAVPSWDARNAANKAFCAAFFLLPISKPLTFISLALAFLLLLAGGELRHSLPQLRKATWVVPALLLAVVPLLAIPFHVTVQENNDLELVYYWVIAFFTALAAGRMAILPWLRAFVIGVLAVACFSGLTAVLPVALESRPAAQGNYILYSQFLAIGIGIAAVLFHHERQRAWRLLYVAAALVFFLSLVFSQGRSGMLALLALLPLVFTRFLSSTGRIKVFLACVAAVVLMALSPVAQDRVQSAVQEFKMYGDDQVRTSIGYRFEMWHTAWRAYLKHPVIGAGPEGFSTEWKKDSSGQEKQATGFIEPHNAFLFYASRYGTLGLGALIWLYGAMLVAGWRTRRSMEGGIVLAFAIVCVVGSLTNTMFMGAASRTWMMLFIGLQGALLYAAASSSAAATASPALSAQPERG